MSKRISGCLKRDCWSDRDVKGKGPLPPIVSAAAVGHGSIPEVHTREGDTVKWFWKSERGIRDHMSALVSANNDIVDNPVYRLASKRNNMANGKGNDTVLQCLAPTIPHGSYLIHLISDHQRRGGKVPWGSSCQWLLQTRRASSTRISAIFNNTGTLFAMS